MRLVAMSAAALDVEAHLAAVDDATMGATTTFVGRVRDHDPDATGVVVALEYTAHPDAERTLGRLAAAAIGSGSAAVAVSHRVGRLAVGEAAVVIAVSAPHRDEAFVVCRRLIEAIKSELPVWKRQIGVDGEATWKGLGG